jgi:plastocyanin
MRTGINAEKLTIWLMAILLGGLLLNACETSGSRNRVEAEGGQMSDSDHAMTKSKVAKPDASMPNQATGKSEIEIKIENFVFEPADITVARGTRVTWINNDDAPHTATATDGKFNSGGLDSGDKYSFVFDEPGDFPYYCALHPRMKAMIRVK